jgi:hypothetical protein
MNFRIKKYPRGFVVEYQYFTWYGGKRWKHFIHASGLPNVPWHHRTYDGAEMNLLYEIKARTRKNSKKNKKEV